MQHLSSKHAVKCLFNAQYSCYIIALILAPSISLHSCQSRLQGHIEEKITPKARQSKQGAGGALSTSREIATPSRKRSANNIAPRHRKEKDSPKALGQPGASTVVTMPARDIAASITTASREPATINGSVYSTGSKNTYKASAAGYYYSIGKCGIRQQAGFR
ncbi:MAG: hypothetical protein ACX93T_03155 [Bacteroidota bacterium]